MFFINKFCKRKEKKKRKWNLSIIYSEHWQKSIFIWMHQKRKDCICVVCWTMGDFVWTVVFVRRCCHGGNLHLPLVCCWALILHRLFYSQTIFTFLHTTDVSHVNTVLVKQLLPSQILDTLFFISNADIDIWCLSMYWFLVQTETEKYRIKITVFFCTKASVKSQAGSIHRRLQHLIVNAV